MNPATSFEDADDYLAVLQQEYLADAPTRLAELRKDLAALRAGESDAEGSLQTRFHRLAGSGGSYGFPEVTDISRGVELWLKAHQGSPPEAVTRVETAIAKLAAEFDRAAREIIGAPSPIEWPQGFGWSALVAGPPSPGRHRVTELLEAAEYTVRAQDQIPAVEDFAFSTRPDLVLLVPADPADVRELPERWGAAGHAPCRAVLLIDPDGRSDPLHAARQGVDRVIPRDQLEQVLPAFARSLARAAALPLRLLVVTGDDVRAAKLTVLFEKQGLKPLRVANPTEALAALQAELPDLVLLDGTSRAEALPFARVLRGVGEGVADGRLGLLPLLWLTGDPDGERLMALASGMDDVAPATGLDVLPALVRIRAERGRAVRTLAHQDDLTGLLNATALYTELEYGLAYARRNQEPLTLILLDLDHLTRINDRYGFAIGDQVLGHIGQVLRETVRPSDTVGRLGGEEFALLLRRCDARGAARSSEKLRDALLGRPATATGAGRIPIRVSGGVAVYPGDGEDAAAMLHAAGQALARAKAAGRNRIERAEGGGAGA